MEDKRLIGLNAVWLCLLLVAPQAFAEKAKPYAKVLKVIGKVTLNGKALKDGEKISTEGPLESAPEGRISLRFIKKSSVLNLGPDSRVVLKRLNWKDEEGYQFEKGTCRWKISKRLRGKKRLTVKTRSATMGVRGTDFVAKYNPLLGETELIVIGGKVQLSSSENPSDSKLVKKGQWGGIGGRFGKKIGPLINLSTEVLDALAAPVEL